MRFPHVLLALGLVTLLFSAPPLSAQNLTSLADLPDYRRLDVYQGTMTRAEFTHLLETLYAPHGGWQPFIRLDPDAAVFRKTSVPLDDLYTLRFAPSETDRKPLPPAYWRPRAGLPLTGTSADHPLAGLRVALDPGHLGGRWAQLEERWFQIGDAPPIMEGEMTLQVARVLADRLRALGASVDLVRDGDEPATPLRPADLVDAARRQLAESGIEHPHEASGGAADPDRQFSVPWTSDMLFTRADIRARGQRVNTLLKPDLALCLHFNAEAWGDPAKPALVDKNHLHVLVNGCYGPDEIAKDDVRFEMLLKLLNRSSGEELAVAEPVATALAAATGLPPYQYTGQNAVRVDDNPYVWARNLLANRVYECPVVYIEPYVMNSPEVFARVRAGDYDGTREFGGVERKSIFREYADAVAEGVAAAYGRQRASREGRLSPAVRDFLRALVDPKEPSDIYGPLGTAVPPFFSLRWRHFPSPCLVAKPPTIRSLAALAGVSKATVSLALRDSPKIPASERVALGRAIVRQRRCSSLTNRSPTSTPRCACRPARNSSSPTSGSRLP